jgi:hypothetical protein
VYFRENYFERVREHEPLRYRVGAVLWTGNYHPAIKKYEPETNKTDCSGMVFGYLVHLGIFEKKTDLCKITKCTENGYSVKLSKMLISLWTPIKKEEIKRWDWIYRERADGTTHIAVACYDGKLDSFDLYKGKKADCRNNYGYVKETIIIHNPVPYLFQKAIEDEENNNQINISDSI